MTTAEITETIRELRKHYGDTQQNFAHRLHLAISSLANYERGSRRPDIVSLLKFALAARRAGQIVPALLLEDLIKDECGVSVITVPNDETLYTMQVFQVIMADPEFAEKGKELFDMARRAVSTGRLTEKARGT